MFNNGSRQLDRKMTVWLLILDKMIAPSFFIPLAPDNADLRSFPSYLADVLNEHKLRLCAAVLHSDLTWEKQYVTFKLLDIENVQTPGQWCHTPSVCFPLQLLVLWPTQPTAMSALAQLIFGFITLKAPNACRKKEPTKTNSREGMRFNANEKTVCGNNTWAWCNWFVT